MNESLGTKLDKYPARTAIFIITLICAFMSAKIGEIILGHFWSHIWLNRLAGLTVGALFWLGHLVRIAPEGDES